MMEKARRTTELNGSIKRTKANHGTSEPNTRNLCHFVSHKASTSFRAGQLILHALIQNKYLLPVYSSSIPLTQIKYLFPVNSSSIPLSRARRRSTSLSSEAVCATRSLASTLDLRTEFLCAWKIPGNFPRYRTTRGNKTTENLVSTRGR